VEYRDFDLWIEAATPRGYPLRAVSETQGGVNDWMVLDPQSPALQGYKKKIREEKTDVAFLIEFGTYLYNILITGTVGSLFEASLGEIARQEGQGLRLRLHIAPPEVAALPWEFLYSPLQHYFIGTSVKTPLTRHPHVFQPIQVLKTSLPLHVLVAIPDGSGLNIAAEKEALEDVSHRLDDAVQFKLLEGKVTRSTLSDALIERQYHAFHFIGHTAFAGDQGGVLFNGEEERFDIIDDEVFARFFLDHQSLKLVILNTCRGARRSPTRPMTGIAQKLVVRGIPAVVAHQYPLTDAASIRFAREFYRSLCIGPQAGHVDAAVAYARNQLSIHFPAEPALGAPVLFLRSPEGLIFDLVGARQEQTQPPEAPELSPKECKRLEHLLTTHERNRRVLEEQILRMGAFAPDYMKAQLAEETAAIEEIRQKLGR